MKTNTLKPHYLIIILLLALIISICTACGETEQGAIPILKVGDTWVAVQGTTAGTEQTLTYVVTGEEVVDGIDCSVVELTNDPPGMGLNSVVSQLDKMTMDHISGQMQYEIMDSSFVVDINASYQYTGQRYPLKVGNTWEVTETVTTFMDETETGINQTTCTYEVEKIEKITVPVGIFSCFKVLKYDDSGVLLTTSWFSDETKHIAVKEIYHKNGDILELISFSVSD